MVLIEIMKNHQHQSIIQSKVTLDSLDCQSKVSAVEKKESKVLRVQGSKVLLEIGMKIQKRIQGSNERKNESKVGIASAVGNERSCHASNAQFPLQKCFWRTPNPKNFRLRRAIFMLDSIYQNIPRRFFSAGI